MTQYKCDVQKANGKMMKKLVINADSEAHLMKILKEQDLYLIAFKAQIDPNEALSRTKRISTKNLALLCRQLASMLSSGITLIKALSILYQQMDAKALKNIIKALYESVQKGDQFSEALKKQRDVFPELMVSMVESGEAGGRLDSAMAKLAENFENDLKLHNKIKGALTYPIILFVIAIGVVLILVTVVLPTFTSMFVSMGVELPLATKILISIGGGITHYWYVCVFAVILLVVAFRTFVNTEKGRLSWDGFLLKIPIFRNTITKIVAVRFSRTLAALLSSGITLLQSLDIVIKVVNNQVIRNMLMDSKEDIRKGLTLSQSLRKVTYMPAMVNSMVGIGEESGTMEEMLEKTAVFFDAEVETAIQRLIALIEPIMIIVMGGMVAFIIISVLMPVFDLYSAIGG